MEPQLLGLMKFLPSHGPFVHRGAGVRVLECRANQPGLARLRTAEHVGTRQLEPAFALCPDQQRCGHRQHDGQ